MEDFLIFDIKLYNPYIRTYILKILNTFLFKLPKLIGELFHWNVKRSFIRKIVKAPGIYV